MAADSAVPSTSSLSPIARIETEFNYEEVKSNYMRQIEMYYLNRTLAVHAPWTRKVVDKIKMLIKEGAYLKKIGHPSKHAKYRIMDKYEIYTENGEEMLIYKRKQPDDRVIQVLGAEDCFDVIADAHIKTEHGGHERIMKTLRLKYSVPKTSIDFMLALCNVCLTNKNTEYRRRADNRIPQIFHSRGQVSIIDMTTQPDQQFKHILFYVDRFTKYMLLRPLVTNSETEVAMELLKIFLDFGPPEKLETYDKIFFTKVLSFISTAYEKFNIPLMIPVKLPEIGAMEVRKLLKSWEEQSGSKNWAMGCYVVQWENNSATSDHRSPYQGVFKQKPWMKLLPKDGQTNSQHKSKNKASSLNNDCDSLDNGAQVITDSEDDKNSLDSEVAEITEENGNVLATIIMKQPTMIESSDALQSIAQPQITECDDIPTSIIMKPPSLMPIQVMQLQPVAIAPMQPSGTVAIKTVHTIQPEKPTFGEIVHKHKHNRKEVPKPTNTKCHICKTFINKPYICINCNRNVHLFCSDRLMKQDISLDVVNVTCTSCRLVANRIEKIEKLKQKSVMDNNIVDPDNSEKPAKQKKTT